jgi:hypothetical protein
MSTQYRVSKCKYITFSPTEKEWENTRHTINKLPTYYFDKTKSDFGLPTNKRAGFNFVIYTHGSKNQDVDHELTCSNFPDIKFPKTEDAGASSKQVNKTQDVKKDAMLGGGNNILAFSKQQFTVIAGKSNAGIQSVHSKQNHGVVDVIAKNGILTSPKSKNSIKTLFELLSEYDSFEIVIICPYLISYFDGKYPSDYSRPSYIVGKGELSAVFFWYICLYFFGYSCVYDDTNIERNYDV